MEPGSAYALSTVLPKVVHGEVSGRCSLVITTGDKMGNACEVGDDFQGVPDLPGKAGWLSSSDKDFLDKRKAGLSSYLRSITLDPALSQNEDVYPVLNNLNME